jgi:hypothetical protein
VLLPLPDSVLNMEGGRRIFKRAPPPSVRVSRLGYFGNEWPKVKN